MAKRTVSNGIADEVLERLRKKARPARGKKTLVLTTSKYLEFEKICRKDGQYPSDVIDEFISVFLDEKGVQ